MDTRALKYLILFLPLFSIGGCSTVGDNYAFWRDDSLSVSDLVEYNQQSDDVVVSQSHDHDNNHNGFSVTKGRSVVYEGPLDLTAPPRSVPVETDLIPAEFYPDPRLEQLRQMPGNDEEVLESVRTRLLREHDYAFKGSDFLEVYDPQNKNIYHTPHKLLDGQTQAVDRLSVVDTVGGQKSVRSEELELEAFPVEEQIAQAYQHYTDENVVIDYGSAVGKGPHYDYGLSRAPKDLPRKPRSGQPHTGVAVSDLPSNPMVMADGRITIMPIRGMDLNNPQRGFYGTPVGEVFYFGHGSSQLSGDEKESIRLLAKHLRLNNKPVRIVGHASKRVDAQDETHGRILNLKMSMKRVDSVAKEFARYGVNVEYIDIAAHGDSLSAQSIPDGMSQEDADRRVEIIYD